MARPSKNRPAGAMRTWLTWPPALEGALLSSMTRVPVRIEARRPDGRGSTAPAATTPRVSSPVAADRTAAAAWASSASRCRISVMTSWYPRMRSPPAFNARSARVQKSRLPLLWPVSTLATPLRLVKIRVARSACLSPAAFRSRANCRPSALCATVMACGSIMLASVVAVSRPKRRAALLAVVGEDREGARERRRQAVHDSLTLRRCGQGRLADYAAGGVATHAKNEQMWPLGDVVRRLVAGADQFRARVQQDGRFQFSGVHVIVSAAGQAGRDPGGVPVMAARIQRQATAADIGLLHDVRQHVVTTVPIDENELANAGLVEGMNNISDDRGQRGRPDAHRA